MVFCLVLLIIPLAAASTPITIKSAKFQKMNIYILDDTQVYLRLESYLDKNTGTLGQYQFTSTVNVDQIKIKVDLKDDDGNTTKTQIFEHQRTGSPLILEVYPDGYVPPASTPAPKTNTTPPQNNTPPAPVPSASSSTTNASSAPAKNASAQSSAGSTSNFQWNIAIWIALGVAALLAIAVIVFFVWKVISARRNRFPPIKPSKHGKDKPEPSKSHWFSSSSTPAPSADEKSLADAEKKIKEAQAQIAAIRNRDRISAAERKLAQDREELERLRRGEA